MDLAARIQGAFLPAQKNTHARLTMRGDCHRPQRYFASCKFAIPNRKYTSKKDELSTAEW